MSPNVANVTIKHDGIIRSIKISCNSNLGFIEVKPDRSSNWSNDGFVTDRLKIIETMTATLKALKARNVQSIIIGGIICHGKESSWPMLSAFGPDMLRCF